MIEKPYHLAAVFETSKGHFCDRVLFVRRLLRRQQRGEGSQREVNAGEALKRPLLRAYQRVGGINLRYKIGLELIQIDVEGSVKAQGRRDGRDNLCDQTIQVSEARLGHVEAVLADVIDSLIIHLNKLCLETTITGGEQDAHHE